MLHGSGKAAGRRLQAHALRPPGIILDLKLYSRDIVP
jgi:hypothetical protein